MTQKGGGEITLIDREGETFKKILNTISSTSIS